MEGGGGYLQITGYFVALIDLKRSESPYPRLDLL